MKIDPKKLAPRRYVPPSQGDLERMRDNAERRLHDGGSPCPRETILQTQAGLMRLLGNDARFAASIAACRFYEHPWQYPQVKGVVPIMVPCHREPLAESHLAELFLLHRLAHVADRPTWFRLSEGVTHRLMGTDVRGLLGRQLRVPFHTFAVEVPQGVLQLQHTASDFHDVRCILVAECIASPWEMSSEEDDRHLLLLARCDSGVPQRYFDLCFQVHLADDAVPIEAQDLREVERYRGLVNAPGRLLGQNVSSDECRQLLVRLVLNTCLYLHSDGADVEHEHADEIRRLSRELDTGGPPTRERFQRLLGERVFLVGSSTRVDPALQRRLSRPGSLASRTIIREPWTWQPPGDSDAE